MQRIINFINTSVKTLVILFALMLFFTCCKGQKPNLQINKIIYLNDTICRIIDSVGIEVKFMKLYKNQSISIAYVGRNCKGELITNSIGGYIIDFDNNTNSITSCQMQFLDFDNGEVQLIDCPNVTFKGLKINITEALLKYRYCKIEELYLIIETGIGFDSVEYKYILNY